MTLPAILETLDDAPEALREHYVAHEDGRFRLAVEGMEHADDVRALKTALEREKEARREAKAALDAERERFDGLDPEAARAALAGLSETEERLAQLDAEHRVLAERHAGAVLDGAIHRAAHDAGIRPGALADVLNRARTALRIEDGAPVADGGLGVAAWLESLRATAPHLFQPAAGGGAPGSAPGQPGPRQIDLATPNAIGRNLEALARGEVVAG